MDPKEITVIVPTKNEAHNILPFLQSLPPAFSLVVVDASEDATPELVENARQERTQVLREPVNVTEARQLGARAAQTEWLLFTDADVFFAPDYLEKLRAYNAHTHGVRPRRECDVLYGPKLSAGEFRRYYRWFASGQGVAHRLGIPAASGSNLLVRASAFWACGGFDLRLTCNEDSEIAWRIERQGYKVCFAPDLVVYAHDHRRLYRGTLRKTAHSVIRCLLLYLGLVPNKWRSHDWGYWSYADE
jgi:GT2 family glycosyltransferase